MTRGPFVNHIPSWMFSQEYIQRIAARYRNELDLKRVGAVGRGDVEPELIWQALDYWDADDAWGDYGVFARTNDDTTMTDVMFLRETTAWREIIGQRLTVAASFTGWKDTQFAEAVEIPLDKGRKKSATLSKYQSGDTHLKVGLARKIADLCKFNPNWFLWKQISRPEPDSCKVNGGVFRYRLKLLDEVSPKALHQVVLGHTALKSSGICTGAPSWADPYIVLDYITCQPRRARFAALFSQMEAAPDDLKVSAHKTVRHQPRKRISEGRKKNILAPLQGNASNYINDIISDAPMPE